MKKYYYPSESEKRQQTQQQLNHLLLFQELLRTCEPLNEQFCGKAQEIATGIQPWIDALRCQMSH